MTKIRLSTIAAVALVALCSVVAHAEDISTKKMIIKDHSDALKRQFQVLSIDTNVALAEADDPSATGADVHVYSATDNMCITLASGANWSTNGNFWKYKDKLAKHSAQIGDGKLSVKIKSGVDFSLLDDPSQGNVNVQVQFGDGGTRYCMRCPGNVKDDGTKFIAKTCAVAGCDFEPPGCGTTATTTTSSTTTQPPGPPIVLGALTPTSGLFNYNLTLGLPGSDAACNSNFAGTHTCTYNELLAAEANGDLDGLQDTAATPVTSLWAIDNSHANNLQCYSLAIGGQAWAYATAHNGNAGEKMALTNLTGDLGPLAGAACGGSNWVACCD